MTNRNKCYYLHAMSMCFCTLNRVKQNYRLGPHGLIFLKVQFPPIAADAINIKSEYENVWQLHVSVAHLAPQWRWRCHTFSYSDYCRISCARVRVDRDGRSCTLRRAPVLYWIMCKCTCFILDICRYY